MLRELELDLHDWALGLRRITETIRRSDLDDRLAEIAARIAEIDLATDRLSTEIEASDLEHRLREISESIKREGGTPDLKERLEEVERSLEKVVAELQRVTR